MVKKVISPGNSIEPRMESWFNFSLLGKYLFLAITAFAFYANSIFNNYAFDDNLAIETNAFVQMGVSGIPKILTHDAYAGYYAYWGADPSKQLSGGRYRPLSEIIFAILQQLVGNSTLLPAISHLVNILAYIACILSIFYFLENYLLKKVPYGKDIAFLSTLLFVIHPLHTEVVANIKSLDEIMSMLFIMLTFIFSLKYWQLANQKKVNPSNNLNLKNSQFRFLIPGVVFYFLALLSKEYAVTLLFFIPFLFYLLSDKKIPACIAASVPYFGIFLVYFFLRYNAVGFHSDAQSSAILGSNPYLYATPVQKIATEWFVLGKYVKLLIFPYPLSYDYSYKQIAYHNFSDISVLLSICFYAGVLILGIKLLKRRSVFAFAVFFFLFNLFLVSNFMFDIGATMGERLMFHSSLGFSIILSWFLVTFISGWEKTTVLKNSFVKKRGIMLPLLAIICIACFGETVVRNSQWKNDSTLDIHDVHVVPNSFLANNNAGRCYQLLSEKKENTPVELKAYRDSARKCLYRSLQLNPQNEFTYINLSFVYNDEGLFDSSKYCYDQVSKQNPHFPIKPYYALLSKLYFDKGLRLAKEDNQPREGITFLRKALAIDSTNEGIWYDLGIAYYHVQQFDSEKYALLKTLQLKPDSFDAAGAKRRLSELTGKTKE